MILPSTHSDHLEFLSVWSWYDFSMYSSCMPSGNLPQVFHIFYNIANDLSLFLFSQWWGWNPGSWTYEANTWPYIQSLSLLSCCPQPNTAWLLSLYISSELFSRCCWMCFHWQLCFLVNKKHPSSFRAVCDYDTSVSPRTVRTVLYRKESESLSSFIILGKLQLM